MTNTRQDQDPFVALYLAVAACEPPAETQLADVLDQFQQEYDRRTAE